MCDEGGVSTCPVLDDGILPTRRRRQSSSPPPSNILQEKVSQLELSTMYDTDGWRSALKAHSKRKRTKYRGFLRPACVLQRSIPQEVPLYGGGRNWLGLGHGDGRNILHPLYEGIASRPVIEGVRSSEETLGIPTLRSGVQLRQAIGDQRKS